MATKQNFVGRYRAGVVVTATGKYSPLNDGTDAFIEFVTLTDETGVQVGTPGNPISITGNLSAGNVTVTAVAPYQAAPLGYQQIANLTAATALTVPGNATFALALLEGVEVRWRDDGVNPTTTVGMPMFEGAPPQQFSGDLSAVKFIQVSGAAGASTLDVSYYK